jgi:hypothetical protein
MTTIANADVPGEEAVKNAYVLLKKRVRDDLIPFFL